MGMLILNLFVASILVMITFSIHFAGLVALSAVLRRRGVHPAYLDTIAGQGASILFIVVSLFVLHSAEIWVYTLVYLALGIFGNLEPALYYATSSFTTVGFGDVVIDDKWRMLGAAESANGFLLIGWSTAFLVSVSARVRAFEAHMEKLDD